MSPEPHGRLWVRLTVSCPAAAADAVSAALLPISPNGVVVEEVAEPDGETRITGYMGPYLSPDATADATRRVRALAVLPDAMLQGHAKIETEVVPEEDWLEAFRAHHKPARVGRIVIKPTWECWPSPHLPPRPDDIIIEIDPGLAFGTGQHPTTCICLQELQERLRPGDRVLDFGCGSGILAIAAVKLGAGEVLGIDCDPSAVRVADENVRLNEVGDTVQLRVIDNLSAIEPPWDVVVANINPVVVMQEAGRVTELLRPGGTYICTGIPIEREGTVLEALRDAGFDGIVPRPTGEWIGFVCTTARSDES
ncbi:MAG: 50S ribosomal protein L11 methyltransferase [Armatimonadota bacterium]|jgi:ribosomal protein L11 methyltransferase